MAPGGMASAARRWRSAERDPAAERELAASAGLPRAVAALLASRGIRDADAAGRFLAPRLAGLGDPLRLPGMEAAAERILRAVAARETIAVFGDYDCDGVTSTALLVSVLRALGGDARPFLPLRTEEGYGFTLPALARCLATHRPALIVTVDCGTTAVEAVAEAARLGVDVVVTDHHDISGPVAPALAVVNPKLGAGPDLEVLAGVGVVFKLCHALVKCGLRDGQPAAAALDLRPYLALVALGTVCDVAPLTGENRPLVRHGLDWLRRGTHPGLAALRAAAGVTGELTSYHLAYILGPRLNAAGRVGEADPALELLLTDDAARAGELAAELNAVNAERRRIETSLAEEAAARVAEGFDGQSTFGVVCGGEAWDVGVVGLVASRLAQRYNRPSVVISFDGEGEGRGSCRSACGVDLVEVLGECRAALTSFGGHRKAAGLRIERRRFEEFRQRFNDACAARLRGGDLRPVLDVDVWLEHLGEADGELLRWIGKLEPFGPGNPAPVWGARGLRVVGQPRRVGGGGEHLKLTLAGGATQMGAIGFRLGAVEVADGPLDVLFELDENEYNGRRSLQMRLRDLRPAE